MERYVAASEMQYKLQRGDYVSFPTDHIRSYKLTEELSGVSCDQEFSNDEPGNYLAYYGGINEEGIMLFIGITDLQLITLGPNAKASCLDYLCSALYSMEKRGFAARCINNEDLRMFSEYFKFSVPELPQEGISTYVMSPIFEVDPNHKDIVFLVSCYSDGKSEKTPYQVM